MSKKKKYVDEPRYKAILGFESEFKQSFATTLSIAIQQVTKKLQS